MRLALLTLLVPCLAQAGPTWNRLYSSGASASDYLGSNANTDEADHHPNYLLDDDPKTAWVFDAKAAGQAGSVEILFSPRRSVRTLRLVLFNGDQKSPAQLAANAAPKTLDVLVLAASRVGFVHQTLRLKRKLGPQTFDIPVKGAATGVLLSLGEVYKGSKSERTCLSDVQLFVNGNEKYDAPAELARREALLTWKKERLARAEAYAALPESHPYAATRFEREESAMRLVSARYVVPPARPGEEPLRVGDRSLERTKDFVPLRERVRAGTLPAGVADADQTLLRELDGLMKPGAPQAGAWHAFRRTQRVVLPDHFDVAGPVREALGLSEGTLTPAPGPAPRVIPSSTPVSAEQQVRSNLLLLEGSAEDVKKVYFTHKHIIEDRSTFTETTHVLALYAGGKLSRLVSIRQTMRGSDTDTFLVRVAVPTYEQGKLSRLDTTELMDREEGEEGSEARESGIQLRTMTLKAAPRA